MYEPATRVNQMTTTFHATPVFPRGFSCASRNCGIKESGRDLSLFYSETEASAAAIFTKNQFPGAPIVVGREIIRGGVLRAIVVNSRVSNVGRGEEGIRNARRMGAAAARALNVPAHQVLMSSTGIIGIPLPIEKIEAGLQDIASLLQTDPMVGAEGIMTTDTHPKAISTSVGNATITVIAKGSGMIEPNMATMLAYIFTDAEIAIEPLREMLVAAADASFNMLSIDTDTSTSDTCVIMANGQAGPVDHAAFAAALRDACIRMTEILARDGEGATKLLRVHIMGARERAEARRVAKAVVNSPLIKTMAYGADPNVGRIFMAVGKCFDVAMASDRLIAAINGTIVIENGRKSDFDEPSLRRSLSGDPVDIAIDLGVGEGEATAYGCDLTEGYIKENAAYYSS